MSALRYSPGSPGGWLHFLHGNVPGHQLDWILRPESVPDALEPFHIQNLTALIHSRDVARADDVVVSFGNLSARDTRYRPGHGALAILLHTRILDSADHAGRPSPRLVHAMVQVDRDFNAEALRSAAMQLLDRATQATGEGRQRRIDQWYLRYQEAMGQDAGQARDALVAYLEAMGPFSELEEANPGAVWKPRAVAPVPEVVEVIGDAAVGGRLSAMGSLTGELLRSTLRWSEVTTAPRSRAERGGDLVVHFLTGSAQAVQDGTPRFFLPDLPVAPERLVAALLPVTRDALPPQGTTTSAATAARGASLGADIRSPSPQATAVPEAVSLAASARHPPVPTEPARDPHAMDAALARGSSDADRAEGLLPPFRWTLPLLVLGSFVGVAGLVLLYALAKDPPVVSAPAEVSPPALPKEPGRPALPPSPPAPTPSAPPDPVQPSSVGAVVEKRPHAAAPTPVQSPAPAPSTPVTSDGMPSAQPAARVVVEGDSGSFAVQLTGVDGVAHRVGREGLSLPAGHYTFTYFEGAPGQGDEGQAVSLVAGRSYAIRCQERTGCSDPQ